MIILFSVAVAVDVVLGILAAFVRNQVSSTVSRRGMAKKIAAFFALVLFVVADGILPDIPVAVFGVTVEFNLTQMVVSLMAIQEVLSVLEKMGMLGWPIPDRWKQALIKVREAITNSVPGDGGPNSPFGGEKS